MVRSLAGLAPVSRIKPITNGSAKQATKNGASSNALSPAAQHRPEQTASRGSPQATHSGFGACCLACRHQKGNE
jgi:hypothetical protein